MSNSDFVSIEVNGQRIDRWVSYSVDSDLMTPADAFSFEVQPTGADDLEQLRAALPVFGEVKLYVGDSLNQRFRDRYLQLSGIIDSRKIVCDEKGTRITVEGRDKAALLTDSGANPELAIAAGTTFVEMCSQVAAEYGIQVITSNVASREVLSGEPAYQSLGRRQRREARAQGVSPSLYSRAAQRRADRDGRPLDEALGTTTDSRARARRSNRLTSSDVARLTVADARPQIHESEWEFLSRHAERLGVMMWMDPRGRLVLSAPDYSQEPRFYFVRRRQSDPSYPNNVIRGALLENGGELYSEVRVYGRAKRRTRHRKVRGLAQDFSVPFTRIRHLHNGGVSSDEEAQRLADRALREQHEDATVYTVTHRDHGQDRYLFAVDRMAYVLDENTGAEGLFYVTKRTFKRSLSDGTTTDLRMIPAGAITF